MSERTPAEVLLELAGLRPPASEKQDLIGAYDMCRSLCRSLHAVRLGDLAPLTLPPADTSVTAAPAAAPGR